MVYELRLFVAGNNQNSKQLIGDLKKFFRGKLKDYSFKVFDVIEQPELAEERGVLATPLLEKESKSGKKRVFGNLHDKKRLLQLIIP